METEMAVSCPLGAAIMQWLVRNDTVFVMPRCEMANDYHNHPNWFEEFIFSSVIVMVQVRPLGVGPTWNHLLYRLGSNHGLIQSFPGGARIQTISC